jgi:hypothetical protein
VRRIKDIGLDGPVVLNVPVGNYWCLTCKKFFKPEVPFAGKRKRFTSRAVRKATVAVQQDKTTYTALPHRLDRDFNVRPAKSTGWLWFQEFAGSIDIEEYLRWACGRFSGQLSVDSVADGKVQMWFATDPLNHDLILGYHRAETADNDSLTVFLTALRDKYGIRPQLFACDDANVFENTPQVVWKDVPVQLCHFHVIKNLTYNHLRHSLVERINSYKPVKPPKNARPDGTPVPKNSRGYMTAEYVDARDRYFEASDLWVELYRRRRLFFKSLASLQKPDSIKHEETQFIQASCGRYPKVGEFRAFILDFYSLMDSKDVASAKLVRRTMERKWAKVAEADEHIAYVLKQLKDKRYFARLFAFTAFENAHRTTNSTERANRWFRKRQKTHYRCRKDHTIRRMLHADLVYKRERVPAGEPPRQLRERPVVLNRSA